MPDSSSRKRAFANALDRRPPPRRVLAHVVGLVGDQQRRPLGAAAPVHGRPRGDRRVRHRDAVPVTRLRPGGVRPVRLERDPVPRRVQRPLAADMGRRRDHGDARHAPLGEHPMRHVQAERGLAGGGRRRSEERLAGVIEDGGRGRLLPRAQRSGGGPGRQGATRRAGRSDLVRHRARQASQRTGRRSAGGQSTLMSRPRWRAISRAARNLKGVRPPLQRGTAQSQMWRART